MVHLRVAVRALQPGRFILPSDCYAKTTMIGLKVIPVRFSRSLPVVPILMAVALGGLIASSLEAEQTSPSHQLVHTQGESSPAVSGGQGSAAPCTAGQPPVCSTQPRGEDDLWVISTRQLSCSCPPEAEESALEFLHYDPSGVWRRSSRAAFAAADNAEVITCYYIHGNRIDPRDAIDRGSAVYHALVAEPARASPLRYVIWSWPSGQLRGPLRDARAKSARSDTDGYYLARHLTQVDSGVRLSLIGYSYGARIATGALHLLGGGSLDSGALPERPRQSPRAVRTVLMVAALHSYWLDPGEYHQQAVPQTDRMLLLNNPCDQVLRRYRMVFRRGRPAALGYVGLDENDSLLARGRPVEQRDVSCIVGRSHDMKRYIGCPSLMRQVQRYALWETLD